MPNYIFPTDAKRKVIRIDLASVSYEVGYEGVVDETIDSSFLTTFFSLVDGEITIIDDSVDYVIYPSGVNVNIDGSVYPDSWIGSMSLNLTGSQKFFVVKTSSSLVFHSVSQFVSDFGSVPTLTTTFDLSPILTAITSAKTEILNNVPSIDLTSIEASLTTIKGYTDTLESDLAIVKNGVSGVINNSLNGIGCEFKDGALVTLDGRDTIFTVKRSSFCLLDDSTYTAFYDLEYPTGETLSAPESLLTRYVAPVTTP